MCLDRDVSSAIATRALVTNPNSQLAVAHEAGDRTD